MARYRPLRVVELAGQPAPTVNHREFAAVAALDSNAAQAASFAPSLPNAALQRRVASSRAERPTASAVLDGAATRRKRLRRRQLQNVISCPRTTMSSSCDEQFKRHDEVHLKHLRLKGLQPKTIEAYARAVRSVGA